MKTQTRSPTSFLPLGFSVTEFDSEVGDRPQIIPLFSNAFNLLLTLLATTVKRQHRQWHQLLLEQVATNLLTIRPDRSEPRDLKLRPKPYPRMQEPRSVLKAKLRT